MVTKDTQLTLEEELAGRRQPTQFGRLLDELGVSLILARSLRTRPRLACCNTLELLAVHGVGIDVAGNVLVAWDNARCIRSEAAFAALCGVAPVPASSGKTNRHRLSRGGDRTANRALWRIVLTRTRTDERTREYLARRQAEGKSKREVVRCLKRYVAREIYHVLQRLGPGVVPA